MLLFCTYLPKRTRQRIPEGSACVFILYPIRTYLGHNQFEKSERAVAGNIFVHYAMYLRKICFMFRYAKRGSWFPSLHLWGGRRLNPCTSDPPLRNPTFRNRIFYEV